MIGNSIRENSFARILLPTGGVARGNTVSFDVEDGIECDAGCAIRGNVVRSSEGFGLNLGAGSAYTGNTITANTGGTVVGGVARSENDCDEAAAPNCP
jgi:pyruvate carboxylase